MITLDMKTADDLLAMPVTRTMTIKMEDRNFTIIDTEFFRDLCKRARIRITPVPTVERAP